MASNDQTELSLSPTQQSFLVAAWFRGCAEQTRWLSNADQIVALSLYYTGDITFEDCTRRFSTRGHVPNYDENGDLLIEVRDRYRALLDFVSQHSELLEARGDIQTPADPAFTSCHLTALGLSLASELIVRFPKKPEFPHWPDKRSH